jgi:DNA-binding NarL/FixJ family response regulator
MALGKVPPFSFDCQVANMIMIVLLIEDNDDDALMATWAVEEVNHRLKGRKLPTASVSVHRTAAEGLKEAVQNQPHLVVTDISLPGDSGLQLLEALKSNAATMAIPVAILSNSDALADVRRAYELNAAVYLQKPDSYEGLVEIWFALLFLFALARHP